MDKLKRYLSWLLLAVVLIGVGIYLGYEIGGLGAAAAVLEVKRRVEKSNRSIEDKKKKVKEAGEKVERKKINNTNDARDTLNKLFFD